MCSRPFHTVPTSPVPLPLLRSLCPRQLLRLLPSRLMPSTTMILPCRAHRPTNLPLSTPGQESVLTTTGTTPTTNLGKMGVNLCRGALNIRKEEVHMVAEEAGRTTQTAIGCPIHRTCPPFLRRDNPPFKVPLLRPQVSGISILAGQ